MLPLLPRCLSRAPANGEKSGALTSGTALILHLIGVLGCNWAVLGFMPSSLGSLS